jgi:phosphoserine phosphatase
MPKLLKTIYALACAISIALLSAPVRAEDPLPSWTEGTTKRSILAFVAAVTDPKNKDFVDMPARIATFDNDGTLWAEQPLYFELMFSIDRIKQLAPKHPEWKAQEPYASILRGDPQAVLSDKKAALELIAATHAGMTTDEFQNVVKDWLATAKHPRFKRPYTALAYQPMRELLHYLRSNGFKTFIVSGGGVEFMRAMSVQTYGVPPQEVIGSSGKQSFEIKDGKPQLTKLPEVDFIDDKAGKPLAIQRVIGRRPIAAFGNSDGDLEMLQYTCVGERGRLCLIVHHTDAAREWAYDRDSKIGHLDKALDEAQAQHWTIASIKTDWVRVFVDAPGRT